MAPKSETQPWIGERSFGPAPKAIPGGRVSPPGVALGRRASTPSGAYICRMSDGRMRLAVALVVVVAVGVPAAPTPAATSPPVAVSVSSGGHHTCALMASGGVKCWGNNYYGELGDGTGKDSKTPVGVSRLPSGATAISAGYGHACALTPGGGVKCWGENGSGQLGDGTTASYREAPVDVSGLSSGVAAISAGYRHACALMNSGAVKCWGSSYYGQLGDGYRG